MHAYIHDTIGCLARRLAYFCATLTVVVVAVAAVAAAAAKTAGPAQVNQPLSGILMTTLEETFEKEKKRRRKAKTAVAD